jgi:hypothetical protein
MADEGVSSLDAVQLSSFVSSLPKIEVHAHLNGSIPPEAIDELIELAVQRNADNADLRSFRVPDTLESIESYVPCDVSACCERVAHLAIHNGPLTFLFLTLSLYLLTKPDSQ